MGYEEEERRAAEKHLRKQISLFKMLALSASGVVGFRAASSSGASASASAMHGSTTSIRRCVGGRRRRRGGARQQKDVFCRSEALDSSAFKELLGSFDGSPAFSGKTEKNKGEAAEREEEKNPSTSSAESVAYL